MAKRKTAGKKSRPSSLKVGRPKKSVGKTGAARNRRASTSEALELGSIEKIGPTTSKSLLKHTGKNWDYWLRTLESAGARAWDHKRIVAFLAQKKVSLWWRQWIAGGYETHVGKRMVGRDLKGKYSIIITRSFKMPAAQVWKKLSSPEGIAAWLKPMDLPILEKGAGYEVEGGVFGVVRTLNKGKSIRLSWQELDWDKPTIVQAIVYPKAGNTCILCFQHEQLTDGRMKEPLRALWKRALQDFEEVLGNP